jgi:hypothetical protein
MKASPEIEDWFATKKPPAEAAMRRVREIILSADPRLTECNLALTAAKVKPAAKRKT